jgi:hypothetical protein
LEKGYIDRVTSLTNLSDLNSQQETVAQLGLPNTDYNWMATNRLGTIGVDLSYRL